MLSRRAWLQSTVCACAACAVGGIAAAAEPERVAGPGYALWFIGRQHDVMTNPDLPPALDLRTLSTRAHLYGIGPIAGMTGEVTIADGRPALARVAPDRVVTVEQSFEAGAPFFVWGEVPTWTKRPLPPSVSSFQDLEREVPKAAAAAGLDPERPLPFLVLGAQRAMEFHVLDRKPDTGHGPHSHRRLQETFELTQVEATLVGFHSAKHRGVFTPGDSNIHVHFQTTDNRQSGHVQKLQLGADAILALPSRA